MTESLKIENQVIVGVISDTHGLLRPEAIGTLRGSEHTSFMQAISAQATSWTSFPRLLL